MAVPDPRLKDGFIAWQASICYGPFQMDKRLPEKFSGMIRSLLPVERPPPKDT
jgi:hypothetical protein